MNKENLRRVQIESPIHGPVVAARLQQVEQAAWEARHAYYSCAPASARKRRLSVAMLALAEALGQHQEEHHAHP